jgi:hypothetical protein
MELSVIIKKIFAYLTFIFLLTGGLLYILSPFAASQDRKDREEIRPVGPNDIRIPWVQLPGADPFTLLGYSKEVQNDIGLTQKQLDNLMQMERLFRSELYELSYSKEQKNAKEKIANHIRIAQDGMARILTPIQLKRLEQILLQIHGPCNLRLNDDQLSARLQITDLQKSQIKDICFKFAKENRNIYTEQFSKKNTKQAPPCKTIKELQGLNSQIFSLFTDKQREIYAKELGRPFKFKELYPECK